jgi:hypothetical protein
VLATPPISRYVALLAAAWMIVMAGRLYPQFKDAVRVDGKVTTVDDYIARSCSKRIGADAAHCLAAARSQAQRLLRREQSHSILLIIAPVLGYLALGVPDAHRRLRRATAES